jgi:hypothetical protein
LAHLLEKGHYEARLSAAQWDRLNTWMDTYAQKQGSFDKAQEDELRGLRRKMADMLERTP